MPRKRGRSSASQDTIPSVKSALQPSWSFNAKNEGIIGSNERAGKDHRSSLEAHRQSNIDSGPFSAQKSINVSKMQNESGYTEIKESNINRLAEYSIGDPDKARTKLGQKETFSDVVLDDDRDYLEVTGSGSTRPQMRRPKGDQIPSMLNLSHRNRHYSKAAKSIECDLQRGNPAADQHLPIPTSSQTKTDVIPPVEKLAAEDAEIEDVLPEDTIIDNLESIITTRTAPSGRQGKPRESLFRNCEVKFIEHEGLHIQNGVVVELHDGSFLWVKSVWKGYWGQTSMKGYRLVRDKAFRGKLPDTRINELVWENCVDADQAGLDSVLHDAMPIKVKQTRQVVFTNQPWNMLNFENEVGGGLDMAQIDMTAVEEEGRLYCRWKYVQVQSKRKCDVKASINLLKYEETSEMGGIECGEVRKIWGEGRPAQHSLKRSVFDVDASRTENQSQYTLIDCFCGAGGITRGAVEAGLKVMWAFDNDANAIQTYRTNFEKYGTRSLQMNDATFIELVTEKSIYADIVHYSPPCQGFSAANRHTNPAKDLANQQVVFSLYHLTERIRPRIATVEETAGLIYRHQQWFDALIISFTSLGYSVAWKMIRCENYGLPQSRLRLLLIAAAPGEVLPPFPDATHGEAESGLKPFRKIRGAISNIPPSATHQNMMSTCKNLNSLTPFSADSFAKCITTSGGQGNYHPSGTRQYNVRELAMLQGFRAGHHFSCSGVVVAKRQIGNAVPPLVARPIFKQIIKSLQETDGV